jgi:hypothetical protein
LSLLPPLPLYPVQKGTWQGNMRTGSGWWEAARDDNEAIDESNIVDGRTRGAKPSGGYREPGDEEGLPGPEDGTSSGRQ